MNGTKIAITCSDAFVVHVFGDASRSAGARRLFFCNETEACAVSGASTAEEAFRKLKNQLRSVVVTNGPHGAISAMPEEARPGIRIGTEGSLPSRRHVCGSVPLRDHARSFTGKGGARRGIPVAQGHYSGRRDCITARRVRGMNVATEGRPILGKESLL